MSKERIVLRVTRGERMALEDLAERLHFFGERQLAPAMVEVLLTAARSEGVDVDALKKEGRRLEAAERREGRKKSKPKSKTKKTDA